MPEGATRSAESWLLRVHLKIAKGQSVAAGLTYGMTESMPSVLIADCFWALSNAKGGWHG